MSQNYKVDNDWSIHPNLISGFHIHAYIYMSVYIYIHTEKTFLEDSIFIFSLMIIVLYCFKNKIWSFSILEKNNICISSADKIICYQTWKPKFNSRKSNGRRKELTLVCCPLNHKNVPLLKRMVKDTWNYPKWLKFGSKFPCQIAHNILYL